MFCPKCGNTVSDKARFCQFCGVDILEFDSDAREPLPTPAEDTPPPIEKAKKNKKFSVVYPLALVAIAIAFVYLWNGGEYWDKIVAVTGIGQSDPAGTQANGNIDAPPKVQPETPVQANGTAPTEEWLAETPPEELPPEEPLVNDGSLESALRFAAAAYLSESDAPDAESWEGLSVHVTYLSDNFCEFAVTEEQGGLDRLVAQLSAALNENGGRYVASEVEWHWETVTLSYGENYFDNENESVTNADPSAFTLIPNETKSDTYMDFEREDKEAFTLNGVQIMSGVHDTQGNFDAYAQPTMIELTVYDSNSTYQTVALPVIPCEFQGFPFAIVLDEPIEDTRTITLKFLETDGTQEYIAVSEVSFF